MADGIDLRVYRPEPRVWLPVERLDRQARGAVLVTAARTIRGCSGAEEALLAAEDVAACLASAASVDLGAADDPTRAPQAATPRLADLLRMEELIVLVPALYADEHRAVPTAISGRVGTPGRHEALHALCLLQLRHLRVVHDLAGSAVERARA
jgi:hypothetical protein